MEKLGFQQQTEIFGEEWDPEMHRLEFKKKKKKIVFFSVLIFFLPSQAYLGSPEVVAMRYKTFKTSQNTKNTQKNSKVTILPYLVH